MSQLSWTPRQALENKFSAKYNLRCDYRVHLISYAYGHTGTRTGKFARKDIARLAYMFHERYDDPGHMHVWPFLNDRLDVMDALRAALQSSPELKISPDINLEAHGLGFWFIPEEVPVLMREEGLGLKEAVVRVLGEGCGHTCPNCKCDWPVWVLRDSNGA